jgi:glycosyltransferase involved in cell wall biosynthesis
MRLSILLTFNSEGSYVFATQKALLRMIEKLPQNFDHEVLVALDRADEFTTQEVKKRFGQQATVFVTNFGNPGEARNFLVDKSKGEFISILDGDDLWSDNWLACALEMAVLSPGKIFHPEIAFYFYESDIDLPFARGASPFSKSHFVVHQANGMSNSEHMTKVVNFWTAHCLASKSIFKAIPYKPNNRILALGIEDWSWNIATIGRGIEHESVPNTVHCIRVKRQGSLNALNNSEGTLPWLE